MHWLIPKMAIISVCHISDSVASLAIRACASVWEWKKTPFELVHGRWLSTNVHPIATRRRPLWCTATRDTQNAGRRRGDKAVFDLVNVRLYRFRQIVRPPNLSATLSPWTGDQKKMKNKIGCSLCDRGWDRCHWMKSIIKNAHCAYLRSHFARAPLFFHCHFIQIWQYYFRAAIFSMGETLPAIESSQIFRFYHGICFVRYFAKKKREFIKKKKEKKKTLRRQLVEIQTVTVDLFRHVSFSFSDIVFESNAHHKTGLLSAKI